MLKAWSVCRGAQREGHMSSTACWRCTKQLRVFSISRGSWSHCRASHQISAALANRLLHSTPNLTSAEGQSFSTARAIHVYVHGFVLESAVRAAASGVYAPAGVPSSPQPPEPTLEPEHSTRTRPAPSEQRVNHKPVLHTCYICN